MTSHSRQRRAFAAMAAEMTVSDDARCVKHPSGWRFVVRGLRRRKLVLAAPPNYSLSAASYLVEGSAAAKVIELLAAVQERKAAQCA